MNFEIRVVNCPHSDTQTASGNRAYQDSLGPAVAAEPDVATSIKHKSRLGGPYIQLLMRVAGRQALVIWINLVDVDAIITGAA